MTLAELLKAQGLEDDKIKAIEEAMKQGKIYTTNTEGIDQLYEALKGQHESVTKSNTEAQKLIKELQKGASENPDTAQKFQEYETQIEQLKKEAAEKQLESELKVALLSGRAKPGDVDYLIFQIRKADPDLKVGDDGKVRGLDEAIKTIQTSHPGNFEGETENGKDGLKPIGNPLPKGDKHKEKEPETLAQALREKYEPKET